MNVDIIYTHFPHYREPVFSELLRSPRNRFRIFCDASGIDDTIKGSDNSLVVKAKTYKFYSLMFQPTAIRNSMTTDASCVILLGNPFILSNWVILVICRARGIRVFLWTHGWLMFQKSIKERIRNFFYRMSDGLLLYGARAVRIGVEHGFNSDFLHVIGNSLDYKRQNQMKIEYEKKGRTTNFLKSLGIHSGEFFLVVGRLVSSLRMDLLIDAYTCRQLTKPVVVVGDGPMRADLEQIAREREVPVVFVGAVYEEEQLCELFSNAIAVVSPGKVGLLAIHALTYGAAVVTHSAADRQMPEFEALIEGVTGHFFEYGCSIDLGRVLAQLEGLGLDDEVRRHISAVADETITGFYTPERQVEFIEGAITQ